jgi:CheY-like chemotaxis protein
MTTPSPTKTILVVEDEDATRSSFGTVLSEHGYRVALVPNALEAQDYLREYPAPDLILLDMMTRGMDGWRFLKERDVRWTSIPIILTTTLPIASDEWARSLGAVAALRKPINLEFLLDQVNKHLASRPK